MDEMLSNGVKFLLSRLAELLPFQLVTYGLLTVLEKWLAIPTRTDKKVLISFSASLLQVVIRRRLISRQRKIDMRRRGARLPPALPTKKIGGLDVIQEMMGELKDGYMATFLTTYFERTGRTFSMTVMGDMQILTIEPDYIKRVLATEFKNFEKGKRFREATQSVLGTGVFNADDEMWKFHRTMTRPFFSRERISDFELFGRHADLAIAKLKARLNQPGLPPVDFQDLVSRFTLDSATEFLFGSCVHSLNADLPYPHSNLQPGEKSHPSDVFAEAFGNAQHAISQRTRIGYIWPLYEMFEDPTKKDMRVILNFIEPIVAEALKKRQAEGLANGRRKSVTRRASEKPDDGSVMAVPEGETLLGHLVKETDDKNVITDETLNILIAGRDTTAALLTFTVYMLAMHPKVMVKLREEVLEHVGTARAPTYDDVRSMKYLRAVLNETLRLFPPVPFDVRSTRSATVWPSHVPGEAPYYIPGDTPVVYSAYVMHRWKPFWGPDALEFDPDRFIDERLSKYLTPNPFIFLPFNAGPRICLGQQFAYNESSFFLIRLLQSFSSFSLAPEAVPEDSKPRAAWKNLGGRAAVEQVFMRSSLTMNIRGGLWVRMAEAKETEVV